MSIAPVEELLDVADAARERAWAHVVEWAQRRFGREASIESLLFLIGIQSRGGRFDRRLKKEAKQELIMEGTYRVFEAVGLYTFESGSWERAATFPILSKEDQEKLLQVAIIRYLEPVVRSDDPVINQ